MTTRVAVVIPILNEAPTLGQTLDSLMKQDFPHDLMEILIVDGGSTDNWVSIVRSFDRSDVPVRSLVNSKRTTAAAVNLALRSTDAEAILWISGHCLLSPNYLSAVIKAFEEDPATVVGGQLDVAGRGTVSSMNALVLGSRFGTGMASLRFGREVGWTGAVTYALFRRSLLVSVGGLDERLERNQDNEVVARLRRSGTRFRRIDATATYLAPARLAGIWRRAWGNGSWNIWGLRLGNPGLAWWHVAPMAAVGLGVALSVASIWSPLALYTLMGLGAAYALLAIGFACAAARVGPIWTIPVLPVLFFVHHVVYGLGSWHAVLRPIPAPIEGREDSLERRS
jgi:glycosyltransferase involved in cell wall biosynthesis